MIKINDKVYHYATMNKIGVVTNIIRHKNTALTTGGTTESRIYVEVLYDKEEKKIHYIGDLQKYYD